MKVNTTEGHRLCHYCHVLVSSMASEKVPCQKSYINLLVKQKRNRCLLVPSRHAGVRYGAFGARWYSGNSVIAQPSPAITFIEN